MAIKSLMMLIAAAFLLAPSPTAMIRDMRQEIGADAAEGRLTARPQAEIGAAAPRPGTRPLGLAPGRDGLLHVPATLAVDRPAPLLVVLHGAGADARNILPVLAGLAEDTGTLLLVPDSRGRTWDVILGEYGPDVAFLDAALAQVFDGFAIDPERIGIAGFSDGASYALSLGLGNGDLFTHVLAFSPGFMAPPRQEGEPAIFVSHGTDDRVLPIDMCSRRLVPALEGAGYEVHYREFAGGHTVPPNIAASAVRWLAR